MNRVLYKIGLVLAVALVSCLFPMPYGYYILVRFATMIILGCMAFVFYKEGNVPLCIVAISVVLLFQPFFKFALGRTIWNVVDIILAVALIVLWYYSNKKHNS